MLHRTIAQSKKVLRNLVWRAEVERYRWLRGMTSWIGSVAINLQPIRSAWGGGNQWARQIVRFLIAQGYRVRFDLKSKVDLIIMADPRVAGLIRFGPEEIEAYKKKYPQTLCLHRINECDKRKSTNEMDRMLQEANRLADFTVFISDWLFEYHAERWFDRGNPHCVVYNGADPTIFHPIGSNFYTEDKPFRIVTHHWSDNWNKGFKTYQELDRLIAGGELGDTEFWVIGRWPKNLQWQTAKTFGPTQGLSLANLLRQCHVYITASLWEPGGMHHIEGAQCGLPIIYHEDGGGIVEGASQYGVGLRNNIKQAIQEARENYPDLRSRVLQCSPSGTKMCLEYVRIIQKLIAEKRTL
jgi:glycosyltransferase involved in cell wall biosynthesis